MCLAQRQSRMPEPQECAVCHAITTHRMAVSIDSVVVAVVPVCTNHGQSVIQGRWALQVEPEWGGPWVHGERYRR